MIKSGFPGKFIDTYIHFDKLQKVKFINETEQLILKDEL
jgi:hypothetical protein